MDHRFIERAIQDDGFDLESCYTEEALLGELRRVAAVFGLDFDSCPTTEQGIAVQYAKDRIEEESGWKCQEDE